MKAIHVQPIYYFIPVLVNIFQIFTETTNAKNIKKKYKELTHTNFY